MIQRTLRIIYYLVFAVILVKSLQFLYISQYWPLNICLDASYFRFIGWSMTQDLWPYRDFETFGLPLIYYINYYSILVFGESSRDFRFTDALLILVIAGLSFAYLKRFSLRVAVSGFVLCLILPIVAAPLGAFQRDTLMLPFLLMGLILIEQAVLRPDKEYLFFFLAIFASSFAAFIKPTALLFCALLGLYFFLKTREPGRSYFAGLAKTIALGLAAFLATLILQLIPLLLNGAFPTFLAKWWPALQAWVALTEPQSALSVAWNLFAFNPSYIFLPHNGGVTNPTDIGKVTLLHGFILALYLLYRRSRSVSADGVLCLLLFGFVHYVFQRKGYSYHAYPLWIGFTLLLAIVLDDQIRTSEKIGGKQRWLHIILALFLLLGIGVKFKSAFRMYKGSGLLNKKGIQKFQSRLVTYVEKRLATDKSNIKTVQTFEGNFIALGVVMRSRLKFATRYPMDHLFFFDSPYQKKYQTDLMRSLKESNPDMLLFNERLSRIETGLSKKLSHFPDLETFINENYVLDKRITEINGDVYAVYFRKGD